MDFKTYRIEVWVNECRDVVRELVIEPSIDVLDVALLLNEFRKKHPYLIDMPEVDAWYAKHEKEVEEIEAERGTLLR